MIVWRIDETYVKVNGRWCYLYRAIDSHGMTLDFELRQYRNFQSAYHFIKRLIKTFGKPRCLVTDHYYATHKAVKRLVQQHEITAEIHQSSKYRNNLIEQDHCFIKRQRVRSGNYQSKRTASRTISGSEVIHDLYKSSRRELDLIGFSVVAELQALMAN